MNEQEFRRFLKRFGKKDHVADDLIRRARMFEFFLSDRLKKTMENVSAEDLRAYEQILVPKDLKGQMRAVALYFAFLGNRPLAQMASGIREQTISRTRKAFKIKEFRGIDSVDAGKLEAIGIVTVDDMLAAGKTPDARFQLAGRTGVKPEVILELVKLPDLSRLGAVKSVRARLYYDAGVDTPGKFLQWKYEDLMRMLKDFVQRTGFDRIAPLPKELRNTIDMARQLTDIIQY